MDANIQFGRKVSLILVSGEDALDLSALHFRFKTAQQDEESPSNCSIRVFNLSTTTLNKIQAEYSRVVLQAGYSGGAFGVIFDGTIKQFKIGREPDGVNTYLDILAADGDFGYNNSVVNKSLAAGSTTSVRVKAIVDSMKENGLKEGKFIFPPTGGVLPRGKVLFGLAKAFLRSEVQSIGATWSIQDGAIQIIPLTGYLPGEAVVLTAATGLIGRPEQTAEGIKCRCLINPKIVVGGLIQIDNTSINVTVQQKDAVISGGSQVMFNKWTGLQRLATVTSDGFYRVYVAEYTGDTRGTEFYVDLICLTVHPDTNEVKPYG